MQRPGNNLRFENTKAVQNDTYMLAYRVGDLASQKFRSCEVIPTEMTENGCLLGYLLWRELKLPNR